ncbi:MAG: Heavy-metal-associated domain [Haloplasmataceae bacterium]|jgi:hypothetical protein|nr:Heavy-metal-associated domain [Haloplasmataceae bacterium]
MRKFELTMMCSACNWKITSELERLGFKNFDIDMNTSVLTFQNDVNSEIVIKSINNIGYKIEEIALKEDFSDEEIALFEDAVRNGYIKL